VEKQDLIDKQILELIKQNPGITDIEMALKLGPETKEVRNRIKNLSDTCGKILVVDDERSTIETLRISLESDNYSVIEAHTGYKALEKARSEIPDIILLDIMLPDMTGYEVCNKLKKDPSTRSIPIVMLTGMSGAGDKIAGMDLGADDYITKPFDQNVLKARIRNAMQCLKR